MRVANMLSTILSAFGPGIFYNEWMGPDDKICYCYNVPYRKLWHFARREHLQRASQMSECLGAGTGCGWCIPLLKRIFEASAAEAGAVDIDMTPEEYAAARKDYIQTQQPKNRF